METAALEQQAQTWPERARALVITADEHFAAAGELLTGIKALRKDIADTCDPVIAAAHASHKAAVAQKQKLEAPLATAEATLKQAMLGYRREQERKRDEERRVLEAERRRLEEEERLREAVALEAAGQPELAERVLELPSTAPPVVLPPPAPAVAGVTVRKVWKAEVTDKAALVRAIAAGQVPLAAVDVNATVLRQQALSLGAEFRWPGCRAFQEEQMAAAAGARRF